MKNTIKHFSVLLAAALVIQFFSFIGVVPYTLTTYASGNPISISNFIDKETITYELPIIKGTLSTYAEKVSVSVNNGTAIQWTVHPNKKTFKAIAKLSVGTNTIKLSAPGNDDKYLTINFTPRSTGPAVKFTYVIPSDGPGTFRAPSGVNNDIVSAKKRYTLQALLMQSAWAECMYDRGYGRNTFRILYPNSDSSNVVFVVRADKTEAQMRQYTNDPNGLYNYYDFYGYIKSQLPPNNYDIKNFVIPSSSTHTGEYLDKVKNEDPISQAATALGGNDLALEESTYLYKMPEDISGIDSTLYNNNKGMDTDPYSYWKQFGISIGGGIHELGHCFGLNHLNRLQTVDWNNPPNPTNTDDGSSLMVCGFYDGNRLFAVRDGDLTDFTDVKPVNWGWGWTDTSNPAESVLQNDCQILSDSAWISNNPMLNEAGWSANNKGGFIEAEWSTNTKGGNVNVECHTSASGNIVGGFGYGPDNYLTINNIYANVAGTYTIKVYYFCENTETCTISTNGDGGIAYSFSGQCYSVGQSPIMPAVKEIPLNLNAGYNNITFLKYYWGSDLKIDKISLPLSISPLLPISYEAESSGNTFMGNAGIFENSMYSGSKAIGDIIGNNCLVFNNVVVDKPGNYTIRVYYVSGENRTCYISTNHNAGTANSFTGPNWNTVVTKDINLSLREGCNKIMFYNPNGYAPDIDRIQIISIP